MIRLSVILFCLALGVTAQEKTPAPEQYHFLFIVDSSLSMAPRKEVMTQMMRELILSGFVGQAQAGDSVDIWLYDQANNISSFPPQIWEASDAARIADAAAGFINKQKFRGVSRFGPVAADLGALLPNTKKLLVVILTDGEEPLSGISPDLEINEYVAKLKRVMPPKHPFVISLAAVVGRIQQWAVYNGDGKNDMAALPSRPKPAPVVAKAKQKEPEKKAEPQRKKEPEKPFVFDLPPGAKISLPPSASMSHVALGRPQPSPITPNAGKQPEAPKQPVVTTVAPGNTSNSSALPPKASVEVISKSRGNETPSIVTNKPAAAPKPAAPIVVANAIAQKPPTNTIEPATIARPSNLVAIAATTNKPNPPEGSSKPVQAAQAGTVEKIQKTSEAAPALSQAAIPAAAIYGGVALAGLGISALGGFLFLRKAKARQDGSIISQSLLR